MKPEQVTFPRSLRPDSSSQQLLETWGGDAGKQVAGGCVVSPAPGLRTGTDPCSLTLHAVSDCLHWDLLEGRCSHMVSEVLGFIPSPPVPWKAAPSLPDAL